MNIVLLATRIFGNDGVSLEILHWKEILSKMGHKVKLLAGKLDQEGICIPDLFFQSPEVVDLYNRVIFGKENYRKVEADIFRRSGKIEGDLREIFRKNGKIDLLIESNVLSLPMHFPLAVALTRLIEDYSIPTIARHHDFWWQRNRFLHSSMFPFFKRYFPPDLPSIKHIVLSSLAKTELKRRRHIDSEIIGDSFDFSSKQNKMDSYSRNFREDFGIAKDDIVFLQATRIIPRKRIELSIKLVEKLANPKAVLLLVGQSGDEGLEYEKKLKSIATKSKARILFIGSRINTHRKISGNERFYTLWDAYINSNFMTYPSKIEGFGNQFVEAVYFRIPIIVTPYPVYEADIKPLGFETIEMPDKVTSQVINRVKDLINNPGEIKSMVEKNFKIGQRHFSYEYLESKLANIIEKIDK
jgi:glycosyltransferase involved in cell wall biosynthesis